MFNKNFIKDRATALKVANKLSLSQLITVGLLVFTTYHAVTNKTIVEIIPPYLDERITLAYESASSKYHIKYALFTAITMGNVTPSSISTTIDALQTTFTPELYHSLKAQLRDQGESLRKSGSTLDFKPKTWEFEPDTGLTFITGVQKMIPLHGNPTSKTITYEFAIEVNNYVPWIKHFVVYNGVAHNQRWVDENSDRTAGAS